jgi:predicted glycosyltransferase involved in capsule biosynthesis
MSSARNGNSEVPVYFLNAKLGYIVRKIEKHKGVQYIFITAIMKFMNKKNFWYGPFQAMGMISDTL